MPTYDYQCDACGHRFEEFQSMRDDALTVCPSCSEAALRRLITGGTGVIFKGSGFYVTDSKKSSKSTGTAAASGKPSGSDAKSGDAKSTDAKSDTGSGGGTGTDGSSSGKSESGTTSSGEKKTA